MDINAIINLILGAFITFGSWGIITNLTSLGNRIDKLDNRIDGLENKVDNLSIRMFNLEKEFALHNKGHQ